MTALNSSAMLLALLGARRGSIRELASVHSRNTVWNNSRDGNAELTDEPTPPHVAPHRSEPRHRTRNGQALLRRRVARDHLLAPSVSGKLPVGGRTRGPY